MGRGIGMCKDWGGHCPDVVVVKIVILGSASVVFFFIMRGPSTALFTSNIYLVLAFTSVW